MSTETVESRPLVQLQNVRVRFDSGEWGRQAEAVAGVSLDIYPGEVVGITGQSGAGKSTLALGLMGLVDPSNAILTGRIVFDGHTVLDGPEHASPKENRARDRARFRQFLGNMRHYRGQFLFMIFQEPFASLNPYLRIGAQIRECLRRHGPRSSRANRRAEAIELLKSVGLPGETADRFPWELSGGMCQRAMFAMGLALNVRLLVADEPTSSLDVRTQWKVLDIVKGRSPQLGLEDIMDWPGLCSALNADRQAAPPSVGKRIWDRLPVPIQQEIAAGAGGTRLTRERKAAIVQALNRVLTMRDFCNADHAGALKDDQAQELNRCLLEATYPQAIAKRPEGLRQKGMSVMLVTHDLRVISRLADRVAVMLHGLIVESGTLAHVLSGPSCNHPYTRKLSEAHAVKGVSAEKVPRPSESDAPANTGCVYSAQCPLRRPQCTETPPPLAECPGEPGHLIRCHVPIEELRVASP